MLRRRIPLLLGLGGVYMTLLVLLLLQLTSDVRMTSQGGDEAKEKLRADTLRLRNLRFMRYTRLQTNRSGAGEHGAPVRGTPAELGVGLAQRKTDGYHLATSDTISLQRALPDHRHDSCRSLQYPADLPSASVIIIFANEGRSVLLRTAHSVVNRSPPSLLKEVLLVDDASDKGGLGAELDAYVAGAWPDGIVRVLRLPTRSGLIRARLAGARAATGDVIVVLDGHVEVATGWLEPLLVRIQQDPKRLVSPAVGHIDPETFAYTASKDASHMSFQWDMTYAWLPHPITDPTTPIPSVAMVGCAFAMDRRMFFELGAFDDGMDVWGAENVEIGFRLWMCGGGIEIIRCSQVGHLFRFARPYKLPDADFMGRNAQRVAEVWFGDYKKYYYATRPDRLGQPFGDVTSRVALQKRLKCQDFRWFLDHVAPDTFFYDRNVTAWGRVELTGSGRCLDTLGGREGQGYPLGLYPCQRQTDIHHSQLLSLGEDGRLRRQYTCATHSREAAGGNVTMAWSCYHDYASSWTWTYNETSGALLYAPLGLCLDAGSTPSPSTPASHPTLAQCDPAASTQRWTFDHVL